MFTRTEAEHTHTRDFTRKGRGPLCEGPCSVRAICLTSCDLDWQVIGGLFLLAEDVKGTFFNLSNYETIYQNFWFVKALLSLPPLPRKKSFA